MFGSLSLGRAVLTLAMMGGYLNYSRKRYAAPGHQVLWEGCMRLAAAIQVFERARRLQDSGPDPPGRERLPPAAEAPGRGLPEWQVRPVCIRMERDRAGMERTMCGKQGRHPFRVHGQPHVQVAK